MIVKFIDRSRKRKTSTSSLTNGIESSPNQHGKSSKLHGSSENRRSDVIALGTSSGSILIYSLKTGDITSQFSKETAHNGRVNDIVSCKFYLYFNFIISHNSCSNIGRLEDRSQILLPIYSLCT